MGDRQRREFHEAVLDADSFEGLPGKWQAAILEAEQNRPRLRLVSPDDEGARVTAWDFIEAHPAVTWEEIYAREEQWSRDLDPFHGGFR